MRVRALLLALGLGCGWAAAEEHVDTARLERLMVQLGSDKFTERDRASKALDAIGAEALDALKKGTSSPDLEVKRRSLTLVKKIEARLESEKLLAPTRLQLKLDDVPLAQALTELAQKSGHTLVLQGPQGKLAQRRVTLDTGETTFWHAFDALCRQAQLSEGHAAIHESQLLASSRNHQIQANEMRRFGLTGPVDPALAARAARTFSPAGANARRTPIILKDGADDGIACYAGAARIRAELAPIANAAGKRGQLALTLDIGMEPLLSSVKVRHVRLERAQDDLGNAWSHAVPANVELNQVVVATRYLGAARTWPRDEAVLHLQPPDQPGKRLKELKGTVVAVVQSPAESQMTVDDIKNATGKSVTGATGGSIKVNQAAVVNGEMRLRIELDPPADPDAELMIVRQNAANNLALVQAQRGLLQQQILLRAQPAFRVGLAAPGNSDAEGLSLYDAKGEQYLTAHSSVQSRIEMRGGNNVLVHEYLLRFRPSANAGEPAKLVYRGKRSHLVEIPFELRELKLP